MGIRHLDLGSPACLDELCFLVALELLRGVSLELAFSVLFIVFLVIMAHSPRSNSWILAVGNFPRAFHMKVPHPCEVCFSTNFSFRLCTNSFTILLFTPDYAPDPDFHIALPSIRAERCGNGLGPRGER